MSINYAGLHLIAENYVTRPKSEQTYINKMAETIHGMSAYIVPRKVENTYKNMIEDMCNSPQIKHIRSLMANSRAHFGESGLETQSGPPASAAEIQPTKGQLKSAVKQQAKDTAVEVKSGKSSIRFEVKEAIEEAKRLSSAKKAKAAATSSSSGKSDNSFVTARSSSVKSARSALSEAKSAFKARQQATPRALEADFEAEAPTPKVKKTKGLNIIVPEAPAPAPTTAPTESKEVSSRAAKINAIISNTNGANGIVRIIPAVGKGGKGFRPAYVGHNGVALAYLDNEVTVTQLQKMIEALGKVKVPTSDKVMKTDIKNYIQRLRDAIRKRG